MREIPCCLSLKYTQADVVEAFDSILGYLDDLLYIDNAYFERMVSQIFPTEVQLNEANFSDTEAPFLELDLSFTHDILSKIYDTEMILILK